MDEKQVSNGKRAYKLYNKVGATEREKQTAIKLIEQANADELDVYGKFVRAEIIFWSDNTSPYAKQEAFETFLHIILDKQTPKALSVGACFFAGRCFELGFGTDYDNAMAYAHYRLANKINPNACLKDVARLQKLLASEQKNFDKSTPEKFRYCGSATNEKWSEWEYEEYINDWIEEYEKCKISLRDNKFFYPDDPDETDVDMYDVIISSNKSDC